MTRDGRCAKRVRRARSRLRVHGVGLVAHDEKRRRHGPLVCGCSVVMIASETKVKLILVCLSLKNCACGAALENMTFWASQPISNMG